MPLPRHRGHEAQQRDGATAHLEAIGDHLVERVRQACVHRLLRPSDHALVRVDPELQLQRARVLCSGGRRHIVCVTGPLSGRGRGASRCVGGGRGRGCTAPRRVRRCAARAWRFASAVAANRSRASSSCECCRSVSSLMARSSSTVLALRAASSASSASSFAWFASRLSPRASASFRRRSRSAAITAAV